MPGQESVGSLSTFLDVASEYDYLYRARSSVVETLDHSDAENSFDSPESISEYFRIGESALRLIVSALVAAGRSPPATILDYPAGSGRVTRYLTAMFPKASIVAADLYESHVDFCTSALGVEGVVTPRHVARFEFDRSFDLIFCGSLLTHLPRREAIDIIRLIGRSLSPRGVGVVTLCGRRVDYNQTHCFKYISDRRYRIAKARASVAGFGYVSYPRGWRSVRFFKQNRYGLALIRPTWILRQVMRMEHVRLMGYAEMAWDGHLDAVTFARPGIDAVQIAGRDAVPATPQR